MRSFEDSGLREELLRTAEEEDISTPTALQESVIPALRRGGNLVARASSGSGKTLAYTLGVLDRISTPGDEDEGATLRTLVLAPTTAEAERIAVTMVPFAQAIGLTVSVPGSGWGTPPADATLLVAAPGEIVEAVQSSEIKLDGLEAIVVDGASVIHELGDWEAVDAVLDLIPRDAQRVVFSASFPEPVEDLIARRVKRALRYPAEAAVADRTAAVESAGSVGYVLASEREKFDLLTHQLRGSGGDTAPPVIFCGTEERAAELAEKLVVRGFLIGEPADDDVDVAVVGGDVSREELAEELDGAAGQTISYDVPPDAAALRARHAGDRDAVVLIEPRELAHLREIARQAHFQARSAPVTTRSIGSAAALESFRRDLRTAIRQEDLSAQMLVLAPLFEEFTAAEVAAAAAALLRSRRTVPSTAAAEGVPPAAKAAREKTAPAGPAPVTWARLFVSIGSRDDIGPGDLVGTLAGEADIPGSRIGKIEIRDSFSIVEVQADVADQVIRAVNGTTIKGRSVRVDFDRGGPARRPPSRSGGGPRRATRRPPRE